MSQRSSHKGSDVPQQLKYNLYIAQHWSYSLALSRHSKHLATDGQVCLHKHLFSEPVKPWRWTMLLVQPMNSINKDVCGTKLLPATVLTYPVDCVCFCHLLETQHYCLCPNGKYLPTPHICSLPPHPSYYQTTPLYIPLVILQLLWRISQYPAVIAN